MLITLYCTRTSRPGQWLDSRGRADCSTCDLTIACGSGNFGNGTRAVADQVRPLDRTRKKCRNPHYPTRPMSQRVEKVWRFHARQHKIEKWKENLSLPKAGLRVDLEKWTKWRRFGSLTFRLVQMLTGHWCFDEYLHRIRTQPIELCHYWGAPRDSANHTFCECPSWDKDRRDLREALEGSKMGINSP